MTECYPVQPLEVLVQKMSPDGQPSPAQPFDQWLTVPHAAEESLDRILARFDTDTETFLDRLKATVNQLPRLPWAFIAYPDEYRLAGHFSSIRQDRSRLMFTAYSIASSFSPADGIPPLSLVFVMDKAALRAAAASQSPLLTPAWRALRNRDENERWLCISDPPAKDWLAAAESADDDLFRSLAR